MDAQIQLFFFKFQLTLPAKTGKSCVVIGPLEICVALAWPVTETLNNRTQMNVSVTRCQYLIC